MLKIGVLAVQGSFAEHIAMLERIDGRDAQPGIQAVLKPNGFSLVGNAGLSDVDISSNPPALGDKFKGRLDIRQIRQLSDLNGDIDALILPGGESTTMGKLLHELGLFAPLKEMIAAGLVTFGTCAGAILLARQLVKDATVHFGLLDVTVQRNAYGRQLGSFTCVNEFSGIGEVEMVFVRAPVFAEVGESVRVLSVVNERIVAVEQGNMLATSYHPELTRDPRVHEYFLSKI